MSKRYIIMVLAVCMMATAFAKSPEKDAVYKLISKSYTLNKDGSTEFRKRTELQIFTRMTFDEFGETFITYNPDFQELIINEAYTIRKDGSKVETPANAFNPMLPDGCTKCERLNGIRTMVVTHTALEYDAVIVLDYTIRSKNFFLQELMEKVDLQEDVPVEKYVVSVTAPEVKHMIFILRGENLHYKTTESNDYGTYTYTFTDLPERPTDEYLFPNAIASLTFCSSLDENYLVGKITDQNSMQKFDNQKITDFFRSRFTEGMSDMDKILYVRDYIHDNIRTNNLNANVLNYMFASPKTVWESNCALPVEKNILLRSVLNSLGYESHLAFVYSSLTTDLKTLVSFQVNGSNYEISANETDELAINMTMLDEDLVLDNGQTWESEYVPVTVDVVADITLKKEDLENPQVVVLKKDVRNSPMVQRLQPQEISVAKAYVSQLSGKYYELTIDDGNYGTQIQSVNIHNDRQYNVNTRQSDEKYAYTVKLPANVRCLTKPMHKEITVENAKLLIDVQVDGLTVKITRQLSLPQEGISAKNVKKFKAMMGEWEAPVKVVFSL